MKPKNKEELINGIKAFWRTVTPQVGVKYIRHLKKVIPKAIQNIYNNTHQYRILMCTVDCKSNDVMLKVASGSKYSLFSNQLR